METWGIAGTTIAEASTDTVQSIDAGTDILFKNSDGVLISALFITCTNNPLRYAFNETPIEAGLGHILPIDQPPVRLLGTANIRAFRYISSTFGNHAVISFTPFYGDE